MLDRTTYPAKPLPPIAAVFLEAFEAARTADNAEADVSEIEQQRINTLEEGAFYRVRACGQFDSHQAQAASLLANINELETVLDGGLGLFAPAGNWRKDDAHRALVEIRHSLVKLLNWHFENGAGALLPVAMWLGLAPAAEKLARSTLQPVSGEAIA